MPIDRETIVKLVREAGLAPICGACDVPDVSYAYESWDVEIERFAKLVAEHEREAIIAILKGIDETEIESPDGWWETSTGAEFGAGILASIRARGNHGQT